MDEDDDEDEDMDEAPKSGTGGRDLVFRPIDEGEETPESTRGVW